MVVRQLVQLFLWWQYSSSFSLMENLYMRGKVPCLSKRFTFVEKLLVQGNVSCSRKTVLMCGKVHWSKKCLVNLKEFHERGKNLHTVNKEFFERRNDYINDVNWRSTSVILQSRWCLMKTKIFRFQDKQSCKAGNFSMSIKLFCV